MPSRRRQGLGGNGTRRPTGAEKERGWAREDGEENKGDKGKKGRVLEDKKGGLRTRKRKGNGGKKIEIHRERERERERERNKWKEKKEGGQDRNMKISLPLICFSRSESYGDDFFFNFVRTF